MVGVSVSPTHRAFAAYVSGEIENAGGRPDRAEEDYTLAMDLATSAGATFVVGIAAVGLQTLRADAGRVTEALSGYREVIDYWDRAGNRTQQWVTLRNLADLLHQLGQEDLAVFLEADVAPSQAVQEARKAIASATARRRTTPRSDEAAAAAHPPPP